MDFHNVSRSQPLIRKTTLSKPPPYSGFSEVKLIETKYSPKSKILISSKDSSSSTLRQSSSNPKIKVTKLIFTNDHEEKIKPVDTINNNSTSGITSTQHNRKSNASISTNAELTQLCVTETTLIAQRSKKGSNNLSETINIQEDLDKIFEKSLKPTIAETNKTSRKDLLDSDNIQIANIAKPSTRKRSNDFRLTDSPRKVATVVKDNEPVDKKTCRPETSEQTLNYITKQRNIWKQKLKKEKDVAKCSKDKKKQSLHELKLKSRQLLKSNLEKKTIKENKSIMQPKTSGDRNSNIIQNIQDSQMSCNSFPSNENGVMNRDNLLENDHPVIEDSINSKICEEMTLNVKKDNCNTFIDHVPSVEDCAAIKLQAAYRGYCVRKMLKSRIPFKEMPVITKKKSFSPYKNRPFQKVMKSELRITSDLYATRMSVEYPYNFITAVKKKLSMTLNSSKKKKMDKYTVPTSDFINKDVLSQSKTWKNYKNVSNETLMNVFNKTVDSYCIMPSFQQITKSPLNSEINLTPNKIYTRKIDNFKCKKSNNQKNLQNKLAISSFPSDKSISKSQKSTTISDLKPLEEIQNLTVSISFNGTIAKENYDTLNSSRRASKKYLPKQDIYDTKLNPEFNHISTSFNESSSSLPSINSKSCVNIEYAPIITKSPVSLRTPDYNLVWSQRSSDRKTISEDSHNITNDNLLHNQFTNELNLLDSFNESLRHVQLVEETLTSIRKSNAESPCKASGDSNLNTSQQICERRINCKKSKAIYMPPGSNSNSYVEVKDHKSIIGVETLTTPGSFRPINDKQTIENNSCNENSSTETIFSDFNFGQNDENIVNYTNKVVDFSTVAASSTVLPKSESDNSLKYLTPNKEISSVIYTQNGIASQELYKNSVTNIIEEVAMENSLSRENIIHNDIDSVFDASSNISLDSKKSISKIFRNAHPNIATHLNRFCICLISQYIDDENVRSEYLDIFLKVREKTLLDATRSELLCLEIQKKQYQEQIPFLKKKQRGLLLKLQQERNEIKLMKKFQHQQSLERKETLKRQLKHFKSLFTSDTGCKEFKNKTTSLRKSSLMLDAKKNSANSPLKGFDLSFNSETNVRNHSFYHLKENLLRKKEDLINQKKQMDDLLHLHCELQLDAFELKAIENRIKNPTKIISDFRQHHLPDQSSIKIKSSNTTIDNIKDESLLIKNMLIAQNETYNKSNKDCQIDTLKQSTINSPIIPELSNVATKNQDVNNLNIGINEKLADLKEVKNICKLEDQRSLAHQELEKSSHIVEHTFSTIEQEEIETVNKHLGDSINNDIKSFSKNVMLSGANLNTLWWKVTGDQCSKYISDNDYFMSKEDLEHFFDDAKEIALQNLLKTLHDNKAERNETYTKKSPTKPEGFLEKSQDDLPIQKMDSVTLKNYENLERSTTEKTSTEKSVNCSLNTLDSNIEINYSIESVPNIIASDILSDSQDLDNQNSITSVINDENILKNSIPINENNGNHTVDTNNVICDLSDGSDSSKSTAHSLVEELKIFTDVGDKTNDEIYQPQLSKVSFSNGQYKPEEDCDNSQINTSYSYAMNTSESTKLWVHDNLNILLDPSDTVSLVETAKIPEYEINQNLNDTVITGKHKSLEGQSKDKDPVLDEENNRYIKECVLEESNSNKFDIGHPIEFEGNNSNEFTEKTDYFTNMCDKNTSDSTPLESVSTSATLPISIDDEFHSKVDSTDEIKGVSDNLQSLIDCKVSGIHNILLGAWDLMSPSPDHSPRDSPTGEYSPATAAITGTLVRIDEAEELRKKQLAIELEIKALEQQSQIPYCLVREIPDKPPPPYIPPTEEIKPVVPPLKIAKEPRAPIKTPSQVSTTIQTSCDWLWMQFESKAIKSINNLRSEKIAALEFPNTLSLFLFDLCSEIFQIEYNIRCIKSKLLWEYQKKSIFRKLNKEDICQSVENKVKEYLGLKVWPVKENLIINWAYKRQDHINVILIKELYKEEVDWANIEEYELQVKNELTDSIIESLLIEACHEYENVFF